MRAVVVRSGRTGRQCRPKPAKRGQVRGDDLGYALGVEVEQRERRPAFAIGDVTPGSGDDFGPVLPVELMLGDDLDVLGQVGP
jgi:hypothetical protein